MYFLFVINTTASYAYISFQLSNWRKQEELIEIQNILGVCIQIFYCNVFLF